MRAQRPCPENAKDPVYFGLRNEQARLVESIDALDEQIAKAR